MFLNNLSNLKKNKFLTGSLVMLIGTNVYNAGQFAFHFLSIRLIGRENYGDLAALISILGIIGIVQLTFGLTIVKFIASTDKKEIPNFIKWVHHWTIMTAFLIALIVLILSPNLGKFLNLINPNTIYFLVPVSLFFVAATGLRSILQGLMQFNKFVFSLLAEQIVKITLTLILVLIGWSIFGAMVAFFMGVLASFLVIEISLLKYLRGKKGARPAIKPLFQYSSAVLVQGLALTSMYTSDLLLVKHFFNSSESGLYATMAILGRIIYFGAIPVSSVMFPIVAARLHQKKDYKGIVLLSLLIVLVFVSLGVLVYLFWPELPILILAGKDYLDGSKLLVWFGAFMGLLAVATVLTQFYLSIGKTKVVILFILAAILQIILILLYHGSLLQVIQMSGISALLLNLTLLVYLVYPNEKTATFSHSSGIQTSQDNQSRFKKY